MKNFIIFAVVLTLFCTSADYIDAFRCGDGDKYLATKGMHKYQILKDCGPPESKEIVGVDKKGGAYRIAEEWLYIITTRGQNQMYLLKLDEKGILVEIDWLGEQE